MKTSYLLILSCIFIFTCCSDNDESPTPPSADFSFNEDLQSAPATINFTNLSANSDYVIWDFGDESTSTQDNPSHLYDEAGNYNVKLIAVNSDGIDEINKEITLLQPTVYLVNNNTSTVLNSVISFYDAYGKMVNVYEHGDIKSYHNSDEVKTNRDQISVIFYYDRSWLLVATPFSITEFKKNSLSINDNTSVYIIQLYKSSQEINLSNASLSKKIKLKELYAN